MSRRVSREGQWGLGGHGLLFLKYKKVEAGVRWREKKKSYVVGRNYERMKSIVGGTLGTRGGAGEKVVGSN